jgi:hypothetical protein
MNTMRRGRVGFIPAVVFSRSLHGCNVPMPTARAPHAFTRPIHPSINQDMS